MLPPSCRQVLLVTLAVAVSTGLGARAGQVQEGAIFMGPMVGAPMPGSFQAAGPQPVGTGVVAGVVVSADLERPVRRATVRLASTTPRMPRTVTTDDRGRFRFEQVAPGEYTVSTSKPGYLESIYGQKLAGSGRAGTPISLADGVRVEDLTIAIGRGGVIAGVIMDDGGEPAYGTTVQALRASWQGGERTFREAGRARTDDRGAYRIAALPPGEYVVMVSPANAFERPDIFGPMATMIRSSATEESHAYSPVYYPGTSSASGATRLTLGVSEEKTAIDLQLQLVPMGRIEGAIVANSPGAAASAMVQLIDMDQSLPGFGSRMAHAGPDGAFSFPGVPPGRYRVHARTGPARTISFEGSSSTSMGVMMRFEGAVPARGPGGPFVEPAANPEDTQWASADVSVTGENTERVSLVLQPGLSVSGTVQFDNSGAPSSDLSGLRVLLNSAASAATGGLSSAMAAIDSDGSFTITGVVPGQYRVLLLSPTWRAKSFEVNGRDALDFLLDVEPGQDISGATLTLTQGGASVSGTLQAASGQPTADYTIVLFADDARYWTPHSRRIHATRPSTDGRYTLRNLPAGTYRLAAVDDLEDGQWFDPAVLGEMAPAALSVTIGPNEPREQNIRVAR